MAERGYLNLKSAEISTEIEYRKAQEAIRRQCVNLIKDFAYFDTQTDEPTLNLPAVKWSKDGRDLLHLLPDDGQMGDTLTKEALADIPETIRYASVAELDIVFLPYNDDSLTVARITLYGGRDNMPKIEDFAGKPLSIEELQGLSVDLNRYRSLVNQGLLEDSPTRQA